MHRKWIFLIGIVIMLIVPLAACTGPAGETGPAGPPGPVGPVFEKPTATEPVVEATHTTITPAIDGVIDAVWANASELKVAVAGSFLEDVATTGEEVTLKFLYTNDHIYMLAQWADPTWSIARGGSWLWDGSGWYVLSGSAEALEFGLVAGPSEDRIGVMWAIDVPQFEEKGCLMKCHVKWEGEWVTPTHLERGTCRTCHTADKLVFPGAGAYFNTEDALADMWHMKAARALPLGYADDKHVIYDAAPHTGDGGRHGDSGNGFYSHNRNASKTAPLYMETDPTDYYDAMVITQSEIALGEAVAVADLSAQQIEEYWAKYQAITPGVATDYGSAVVPERILRDFAIGLQPRAETGSRSDVLEVAKWSNGTWTAEFARKLVTGHADDVQFDDFTVAYSFDIALFDNTGGEGHSYHVGTPLHLVFAPATD